MMLWHVRGTRPTFRLLAAWTAMAFYGLDLRGSVARLEGLEPPTGCLEGSCSVRLSYRRPKRTLCPTEVTYRTRHVQRVGIGRHSAASRHRLKGFAAGLSRRLLRACGGLLGGCGRQCGVPESRDGGTEEQRSGDAGNSSAYNGKRGRDKPRHCARLDVA